MVLDRLLQPLGRVEDGGKGYEKGGGSWYGWCRYSIDLNAVKEKKIHTEVIRGIFYSTGSDLERHSVPRTRRYPQVAIQGWI